MNPIAVNSKYCNVFTENKRVVCIIQTEELGKVRDLVFKLRLSKLFVVLISIRIA